MIHAGSGTDASASSASSPTREAIHFSRKCKRPITTARFAEELHRNGAYFFIALVLLAGWFVQSIFPWPRGGQFALLIGAAIGVFFVAYWIDRMAAIRGLNAAMRKATLPAEPDDNVRVRCVGAAQVFEEEGYLDDVSFEPRLFFAPAAAPFATAMKWTTRVAVGVGIVLSLGFHAIMFGELLSENAIITVSAGVFLGLLAPIILWPTYIRVVPGRLDVLRFFAFTAKPTQRVSCDLRSAGILLDLPRRVVYVDLPDGPGVELSFRLISRPRRFAYYFLLAAISTHQPGPLPDDELLG